MCKLLLLAVLVVSHSSLYAKTAEAIFAGGCFWSVESDFDKLRGVLTTISGFDGGTSKDPRYDDVASGKTNYIEAVRVVYNPDQISYQQLVDFFWHHIDPTTKNAQFCDEGNHYRSAIFYLNDAQKKIAIASKVALAKKFPKIFTEIRPSTQFYAAEEYHQDYYKKNPIRYKYYRFRCGRDQRIHEIWQKTKS